MDFTFEFLGHNQGKPIDVSKLDITTYTINAYDSGVGEARLLLTHLYYLSLKYLGSLAKTWWLDSKSRQTKQSVESWTAKHISPLIIADSLQQASAWASEQNSDDPEAKPLTVRVSTRSGDLTASYPIDDTSCSIQISLPPTFPLHQATVSSISRVALDEKKWQAWLRITQGVIAFSNNDLISGLTVFKRNIVGALKGQTECAICYSVVAEDGKLPSKKCRTCKNSFHGACLFRWFRSSNGTTCPLCRNPFNYA